MNQARERILKAVTITTSKPEVPELIKKIYYEE
jgi:hypothetical protein